MQADRTQGGESSLVARLLSALTAAVARHPWLALGLSCLGVALALAYTQQNLGFKTDRGDLLSAESEFHRRWLRCVEEFGADDDLVVAVEGDDRDQITAALEDIAAEIHRQPQRFGSLFYRLDFEALARRGLWYLTPESLDAIDAGLGQLDPLVRVGGSVMGLHQLYLRLELLLLRAADPKTLTEAAPLVGHLVGVTQGVNRWMSEPGEYASLFRFAAEGSHAGEDPVEAAAAASVPSSGGGPAAEAGAAPSPIATAGPTYFFSPNGRMALLQVRPVKDAASFVGAEAAVGALRTILAGARERFPALSIGLTGLPTLETDEMLAAQDSSMKGSVLSLAGTALLFILGFRGIRHPLLAVVALLVGMAWSFGMLTAVVGHLNILSVSFAVMLIGLGMDFGIYYLSRYDQERVGGADVGDALAVTAREVAPGIVTTGLTTSVAFYTAALTKFKGLAELGIIASVGILLCVLAALVILPALLTITDGRFRPRAARHQGGVSFGGLGSLLCGFPKGVFCGFLLILVWICPYALDVHYDHNLIHLQAKGLESVEWAERIVATSDRGVWFGLSVAETPEQALQLKAKFEALATVARVEEIASLVPPDQERKGPAIASIHGRLSELPRCVPTLLEIEPAALARQVSSNRSLLAAFTERESPLQPLALALNRELEVLSKQLQERAPDEQRERLAGFQQAMTSDLAVRLEQLAAASEPTPIGIETLPATLRERFIGRTGKWLVQVHARDDVWDMAHLSAFVDDLRTVDAEVTGKPIQTYEALRQMKESYELAGLYALVAISVILWLDLRSVRETLLALAPLSLGVLLMLGIMGLAKIDLNPANMIVLPLILGIGVDSGVHILHDYHGWLADRRLRGHAAGSGANDGLAPPSGLDDPAPAAEERRTTPGPPPAARVPGYQVSHSTVRALVVNSLTNIVGFGSMMIAHHRGIVSLGLVLALGVGTCLVAALGFLPPLLTLISRQHVPAARAGTGLPGLQGMHRRPAKLAQPHAVRHG